MSDNWVTIIPEDARHVPSEDCQNQALAYFRKIAPNADEIDTAVDESIEFRDCGVNFERVFCPSCNTEMTMGQWSNLMDSDQNPNGFRLGRHRMPCCGERHTLHELRYEWTQGFGRFELSAMNPSIGRLSEEQESEFCRRLGCPVRVIYQHI